MLSLLLFVVMNSMVFGGAALVARFGLRMSGILAIVLASAVLGWVYIVVGLELLGLFGQIRLVPAVGLAIAALLIGIFIRGLTHANAANDSTGDSSEPNTRTPPARSESPISSWPARVAWLTVAALTIWATLDVLISRLLSPVLPVSDAPIYHLYFAVSWWQSGTLQLVPTPFGDSAAPYFPANGNVWFTWLLLPWSSELVAKVGQWPFLLLGMLAVFALARELEVRWPWACCPAALWGMGTLPLINAGFADVDLVMATWYLVSTWFLMRYATQGRTGDLVCSALAMGAGLGTKYIAVLFFPWLFAIAAVVVWRGSSRWSHAALLLVCTAIPAACWYVRNALFTGNPLYPLHQELFGTTLLHGWYRREMLAQSEYHIPVSSWPMLVQIVLRGLDPILLPVWLGSLAASIVAAIRGRPWPAVLVLLSVGQIALFWAVNPYQTQDRFLFAAFALLAIPCALLFDRLPLLSIPFAGLLIWHLMFGPADLVSWLRGFIPSWREDWPPLLPPALPIGADSWTAFVASRALVGRSILLGAVALATILAAIGMGAKHRRFTFAIPAVALLIAGIAGRACYAWIPDARFRFIPFAPQVGYTPGWLALAELGPVPRRVAYAGTNLPFYLFGNRLQNKVRYVNINRYTDYRMHDYHRLNMERGEPLAGGPTPDWDRRDPDEAAWLANIKNQEIDVLFVGFVNRAGGQHNFYDSEGFPIERTWADRNPQVFRPIHRDPRTRVYQVNR